MKHLLSLLFALFIYSSCSAQSPIGQGGKQFNFGVGLYSSSFPLYGGVDFGVHPDITAGPEIGLDLDLNYLRIGGRGDYHFNSLLGIPRDWDFYAGLNLGFAADIGDGDVSGLDLGMQIGGRYYWSTDWGVNLEFGGGNNISGGRIGLSRRF